MPVAGTVEVFFQPLASGEEFWEMKKLTGILLTAIFVISVPVLTMAADVSAKVNIVLEDGTIMLYSGAKAGISAGDEFEIKRNDKVVGHIKAKDVQEFVTYATLLDGAVEEMDMAYRTKEGSTAKEDKLVSSSKPAKEEKKASSKKERSSSKKTSKDDTKDEETKSSSRRDRAKERTSESKDDTKAEKKEDKKEDKKTERRPLPPSTNTAEKKSDWKKPIGSIGAGGYGLTGLIYIPTADVIRKGDGSVHFNYMDAEDEKRLMYKDLGFGVTYGIDDDIEIAYTFLNTDYDTRQISNNVTGEADTHIFSFKYQTNYFRAPSFLTSNVTESRLALGLKYFDSSISVNSAGGNLCTMSGDSCSSEATRVFAVMTGKYSMGAGHLGIYYQTGDMVDDSYYDGFSFFAGAEYIVGGKDNSFINRISVLGEYDHKAFYLGTARTPSLGLRYYFQESSHITLNLMDVTDTAIMNIEGAYGF